MQVSRGDAANCVHSLDDIYYFGGQQRHEQEVWLAHKARNAQEIDLNVGDVIEVAGNHWDGFSKGRNLDTMKMGLYPSYKVREKWRIENFPSYDDASVVE